MNYPRDLLNGDPLPWLLEPDDPSVRYWTLRDILGRPADDGEVLAARTAIAEQPLVRELFARQQPAGHWGDDATKPYSRFNVLWQLVLAQQDEQGRWLCGSISRTWPIEKRNRPSKWVTLDGMRILRATGTLNDLTNHIEM